MSVPGRWHIQNLMNKLKICSVHCMYVIAQLLKLYLLIYFGLHRVFTDVCRLPLVAASGGYSPVAEHRL